MAKKKLFRLRCAACGKSILRRVAMGRNGPITHGKVSLCRKHKKIIKGS